MSESEERRAILSVPVVRYQIPVISFAGRVAGNYLRFLWLVLELGSARERFGNGRGQKSVAREIGRGEGHLRPYALSDALTVEEWRGEYALTVQGEEAPADKNCDQIIMTKEELDELIRWWMTTSL